MSKKRKQYNAQLKAKVALEAIRGEKTIAELAAQYEIHLMMIHNWKRQLLDGASGIFETQQQATQIETDTQAQIADALARLLR